MSLYELQQVSLSYGGAQFALNGIDLKIERGEFVGILGPNGAGKSTLLRILGGLASPGTGTVHFEGGPLNNLSPKERARKIALVPQWTVVAFPFSVFELVLMGRHPHLGHLALESQKDLEITTQALEKTDSIQFRERSFNTLSGGEMQRVVVARAIAQESPTLLLDEPSSALDIQQQHRIYGILQSLNRAGHTVIVTTHDLNLAAQYCKRIVLLQKGKVSADGTPAAVLNESRIESIYGTPVEIIRQGSRFVVLAKENARTNP